jgi:hypothetical protein
MYDVIPPSFSNPDGLNAFPMSVTDPYLCGEIVRLWMAREHAKFLMNTYKTEMSDCDATLGELFFRQKQKLCLQGRGGGWHQWLRENAIARSTADRLALQFAQELGLTDQLAHRVPSDRLEGEICVTAHRDARRLSKYLPSQRSRMTYIYVLSDLFELRLELEGDVVRLSVPPPEDPERWTNPVVPSVVVLNADGTIAPVDYELQEGEVL